MDVLAAIISDLLNLLTTWTFRPSHQGGSTSKADVIRLTIQIILILIVMIGFAAMIWIALFR